MKRIPRRIFTAEFKREAIKLVTEQGLTLAEAGRKLDIATKSLRLARSKRKACITTVLPPVSRLDRWSLNTSRCSTIVSDVMRKLATKYPLISLTSFTPAGNNLRHNSNDLPVH